MQRKQSRNRASGAIIRPPENRVIDFLAYARRRTNSHSIDLLNRRKFMERDRERARLALETVEGHDSQSRDNVVSYFLLTRPTRYTQRLAAQGARMRHFLATLSTFSSTLAAIAIFSVLHSWLYALVLLAIGFIGFTLLHAAARRTRERADSQRDFTFLRSPQNQSVEEFWKSLSPYLNCGWQLELQQTPLSFSQESLKTNGSLPRPAYELRKTFMEHFPKTERRAKKNCSFTYTSTPLEEET